MATIQQILTDIDLLYRNTFTSAQKIVWMNECQIDIFEELEIDSVPYAFNTVADTYLYPIDAGIEIDRIKVVNIQVNDGESPRFVELPFKRNDNNQYARESEYWYTIVENNFYVNVPSGAVDGRAVYIYLESASTEIDPNNLSVEPAVPKRYQELLKLGTLKRIAGARKDIIMRNNYDAEYMDKLEKIQWKMKMAEPEFMQPIDIMPRRDRYRNSSRIRYVSN